MTVSRLLLVPLSVPGPEVMEKLTGSPEVDVAESVIGDTP